MPDIRAASARSLLRVPPDNYLLAPWLKNCNDHKPHTPDQHPCDALAQDLDDHMDGWSDVVAQLEHGMVSVDLPSLPPDADVPSVCY